jgi:hypothetical protein
MAKKAYDVAERFQEVARRARETGPVHTGPTKKKTQKEEYDADAYATRPGRIKGPNSGKDVNLPVETSPSEEFRKKMMKGKK